MDSGSFIACPRCGDKVPTGAQFCGNCGLRMSAIIKAPQSNPVSPSGPLYAPPTRGYPSPGTADVNRPGVPFQPSGYAGPHQSAPIPAAPQSVPPTGRAPVGARLTRSFESIIERLNRRRSGQIPQPGTQVAPYFGQEAPASAPNAFAAGLPGTRQGGYQAGGNINPARPDAPFPEPPGMAPERAIVLSMNRSPAESMIDLPVIRVDEVNSHLSAIAEPKALTPAAQPHQMPQGVRSTPVIVQQRQPDGQGAPLPRNQKQFRRRVIASGVAAFLVLVVISGAAWWLLTPPKDPTLVVPTQLGPVPTKSLAAATLFLQPGWSAADSSQVAAAADQISTRSLPAQPVNAAASIAQEAPSTFASRVHTLSGLGQKQIGIPAPMDVSVTANSRYIIQAVDAEFQIIDTNGKVLPLGFVQFFQPVMHSGDVFGEPKVIFDPTGQQWVLVVNEVRMNSLGIVASYFDVAVSLTNSPFDRWHVYQIDTQTDDYGTCTWADNPQLGSNVWGFFISGSSFDCGADGALKGVVLWELPKATFGVGKQGTPLRWTRFTNKGEPLLSLVPAVEAGPTDIEWLVGNDAGESDAADYGNTSRHLHLWAIGPTSSSSQALPSKSITLPYAYADPPQAFQPTPNPQVDQPSPRLWTGDARVASAQFINRHLYLTFTTAVNWEGDQATRSGIYWIDLAPSFASQTNNVSARIAQAGILGLPQTYLFTPTLVADAEGNLFLSAQISSSRSNPGIIYTSRRSSDPTGQMGQGNTLIPLQTGTKPFGAYWGDYAGGSLVVFDSKRASSKLWIAAPVMDPGAQSDQITSSWHTSMWEFDTGGNSVQNIV